MNEPSFALRKGLDIALPGAPAPAIDVAHPVSRVALLGADFPRVRPRLEVQEGEHVRLGQTLFIDRRRPEIRITSPAAGVVSEIEMGERRRLRSLVINIDGDSAEQHPVLDAEDIATARRRDLVELLCASGLWSTLRTRPFGNIPDPGTSPADLFVTAVDTHPLAPRPEQVIGECGEAFSLALAMLARLTDGHVYLCQGPGPTLPRPAVERIVVARFDGPHPAGLPGTHMHWLAPVSLHRTAWHIGYQDVIALGQLLMNGRLSVERVVALAGPAVRRPRLLRTRIGAALDELLVGELHETEDGACGSHHIISGSVLAGRAVADAHGHLGAQHLQICVLPAHGTESVVVTHGARHRAFVPIPAYDRVLPMDILPAPLLRALLIEDDDVAVELGALELDVEDLALLSFVCPARQDYGALLRAMLSRFQARQ